MSFVCKNEEMADNCDTCSDRKDLSRHATRCGRRRGYTCPVKSCGKTFTQSSGLKAHENVHTKLKPYVCGFGDCQSAFGDPSSKARHVKEIHKTTHINVCPVMGCKTRIKRRSAFHAHLRRKHDITDVETVKVLRQPLDQWSKNTPKISNPPPSNQFPILWPSLSPQAMLTYPTCSDYASYSRTRPQSDVPSQTIDPRMLQRDVYRSYDESFHILTPDLCVRDNCFGDDLFSARVGTLEASSCWTMRSSYAASMDSSAIWRR